MLDQRRSKWSLCCLFLLPTSTLMLLFCIRSFLFYLSPSLHTTSTALCYCCCCHGWLDRTSFVCVGFLLNFWDFLSPLWGSYDGGWSYMWVVFMFLNGAFLCISLPRFLFFRSMTRKMMEADRGMLCWCKENILKQCRSSSPMNHWILGLFLMRNFCCIYV